MPMGLERAASQASLRSSGDDAAMTPRSLTGQSVRSLDDSVRSLQSLSLSEPGGPAEAAPGGGAPAAEDALTIPQMELGWPWTRRAQPGPLEKIQRRGVLREAQGVIDRLTARIEVVEGLERSAMARAAEEVCCWYGLGQLVKFCFFQWRRKTLLKRQLVAIPHPFDWGETTHTDEVWIRILRKQAEKQYWQPNKRMR